MAQIQWNSRFYLLSSIYFSNSFGTETKDACPYATSDRTTELAHNIEQELLLLFNFHFHRCCRRRRRRNGVLVSATHSNSTTTTTTERGLVDKRVTQYRCYSTLTTTTPLPSEQQKREWLARQAREGFLLGTPRFCNKETSGKAMRRRPDIVKDSGSFVRLLLLIRFVCRLRVSFDKKRKSF